MQVMFALVVTSSKCFSCNGLDFWLDRYGVLKYANEDQIFDLKMNTFVSFSHLKMR